jgi:hypothetical protein
MKISRNRWVSFYFLVLGAMPIAILGILLQYEDVSAIWASRQVSWFPFSLPVLGLFALTLSALCFPNRSRSKRFWLGVFCASLALVLLWAVVAPGLPMLLCLLPSWFLWQLYRGRSVPLSAA